MNAEGRDRSLSHSTVLVKGLNKGERIQETAKSEEIVWPVGLEMGLKKLMWGTLTPSPAVSTEDGSVNAR